jgi:hypothetical protein
VVGSGITSLQGQSPRHTRTLMSAAAAAGAGGRPAVSASRDPDAFAELLASVESHDAAEAFRGLEELRSRLLPAIPSEVSLAN